MAGLPTGPRHFSVRDIIKNSELRIRTTELTEETRKTPLLTFIAIGFTVGLSGRFIFGSDYERISPVIELLLGTAVFVGVFAASYWSLKRNAQRLHELDDQYFVKHRLTSRTRLLILIGIGIGGWLIWRRLVAGL